MIIIIIMMMMMIIIPWRKDPPFGSAGIAEVATYTIQRG